MKKNNKGFTLVELIVVLVILAILAAILVPALLGYIDRAREKQVTTNAEAALVATQGLMADAYKDFTKPDDFIDGSKVVDLTDITEKFQFAFGTSDAYSASVKDKTGRGAYKVTQFSYYSEQQGKTATWTSTKGEWKVEQGNTIAANVTSNSSTVKTGNGN